MVDVSDRVVTTDRICATPEDEEIPGRNEELRRELRSLLDDPNAWLTTENLAFGGRTPLQVIAEGGAEMILWVVDLTDATIQSSLQTSEQELTGVWESYGYRIPGSPPKGLAPTQELGQALHDNPGIEGCIAYSAKAPLYKTLVIFPQKLVVGSWVVTTISGTSHRLDGTLAPP